MTFPPRLTDIRHRGRVVVSPPREPDVLKLVPPTEDIGHLDRVWTIDASTSPLTLLELWKPSDPVDEMVRSYLIAFGRGLVAAAEARIVALEKRLAEAERARRRW